MTPRSSHTRDLQPIPSGKVDAPTVAYDSEPRDDATFVRPTRIGRYIVLDLVGVGGMGVVCTAYDPKLDRKVALKLLKDRPSKGPTTTGQARLVREAQALAKLSHPNIVTVHDVDTFEGRIYMAMEYIEGRTIAEWLAEERPSWRSILEVFGHAGQGLAAAHAAGITHRDYKPTNVRIGLDGRVRVLDFGLAKSVTDAEDGDVHRTGSGSSATDSQDEDADLMEFIGSATDLKLTQVGRAVGTPAYMPPEQHLGGDVGPSTDQFSFAATLFEALYGRLPFGEGDDAFWRATKGEIEEPPRESEVPGWVYRVVRRALAPRPEERYPSMDAMLTALAADPARRRRRRVGWSMGAGLLSVSGLAAWNLFQAEAPGPCQRAEQKLAGVWDPPARGRVSDALRSTGRPFAEDTAKRVLHALDDYTARWIEQRVVVCEATRVHGEQSEALLDVRMECLDRRLSGLDALVSVFAEDPGDEELLTQAVPAVLGLDEPEDCARVQRDDVEDLPENPEVRREVEDVQHDLDEVNALLLAGRYLLAENLARKASIRAKSLPHGATRAEALLLQARAGEHSGDFSGAEALLHEAIFEAAESNQHRLEALAWAELLYVDGRLQESPEAGIGWRVPAEAALRRADRPPEIESRVLLNLATVLDARGQHGEAQQLQREALELLEELHGESHPSLAPVHGNLGVTLGRTGQYEEAKLHLQRAMELAERHLGSEHPSIAVHAKNLGGVYLAQDRLHDARAAFEQASKIRERAFGSDHPRVAELWTALATVDIRDGEYEHAWARLDRAVGVFESSFESDDLRLGSALMNLGMVLNRLQRSNEAVQPLTRALRILEKSKGALHPTTAGARLHLCEARAADGTADDLALETCAQAAHDLEAAGDDGRYVASAKLALARVALARGRPADAAAHARAALEGWEKLEHPRKGEARRLLHRALRETRH